jgi:DNA polymerase delta subunit 1
LGRVKNLKSTVRETIMQSKQMGKRENKVINIEGRVQVRNFCSHSGPD